MEFLGIAGIDSRRCNLLHLIETVGLDYHTHIEERVECKCPVLVDPAELGETPAYLVVHPGVAVTLKAVGHGTAEGAGRTQTFGVDLLHIDRLDGLKHIERSVACNQALICQVSSEYQTVSQRNELFQVDGQLEVIVVVLGDDVRAAEHIDLEVGAAGGVVLVVAGVIYNSGLELEMFSAILFGYGNHTVFNVYVVERTVVVVVETFVYCVSCLDAPVGDAASPAPVAVAELALEAGLDAEDVSAHEIEALAVCSNHIPVGIID